MNFRVTLCLLAVSILPGSAEQTEDGLGNCGKEHLFGLAGPVKPGRKYARDRLVDITHLALEITPDFTARTLSGRMSMSLTPIAQALPTLALDAVDLRLESVTVEGATLSSWQNTDEQLMLNFTPPATPGVALTVRVSYHAQPELGLLFRTPEMGYPAEDTQVWSQGEPEHHRHWFPCYDYPNERFTSEVTCHVPAGMEVISNGSLVSKAPGPDQLVTWHWRQDQPHVNYLVALAAGYFHRVEGKVGQLPLAVLVPPSEQAQAALAYRDTEEIMTFYQQEIGVPFPWDKYYQVYCHDFLAGGMENTSCTFNAAGLLFPAATGRLDTLHRLNAHEMAHQWFGDLLTCRDWSHLWLNEGFASYYTVLYEGQKNGPDGMVISLRKEAQRVIEANDSRPIVWRDYGEPMEQFDTRAYPRGAWVLHMLRSQLGREIYQQGIQRYVERNRGQIVITEDLQKVLEEVSGRSLDQFFDQWVHHGGVPELKTSYRWDQPQKLLKLTVKQTQKVDYKVLLFRLPIPVRVQLRGEKDAVETQNFALTLSKAEEEFTFPLPAEPQMVRFDPDCTVLAKWDSKPSRKELEAWLQADFLSRWLAVEALGQEKDDDAAELLGKALAADAHYYISVEAAKALQLMGTPEARRALLPQINAADERVRKSVVEALAAYYHRDVRDALVQQTTLEQNPTILARCLTALAAWPDFDPTPLLGRASYHGTVALAALDALAQQHRKAALPQVLAFLQQKPRPLPMANFSAALNHLAILAKDQHDPAVLALLVQHLAASQVVIRSGAATALGELADPAALPALQALAKQKSSPTAAKATDAIAKIRASADAPTQTQAAWKKVESLTQRAEALERQVEKLERPK